MSIAMWLGKSSFPRTGSSLPKPRRQKVRGTNRTRRSRLAVESLEDRCLLSAPVAVNDVYSTPVNAPLTISAPGPLANDTYTTGHLLQIGLYDDLGLINDGTGGPVITTATGTVQLNTNPDGSFHSFTYTPPPGYNGTDTFFYSLKDTSNEILEEQFSILAGMVTIQVGATNDPPAANNPPTAAADNYSTIQKTTLTVPAAQGVLQNDSDPDGDPLQATLVATTQKGTLEFNPDGSFTYTPPNDVTTVSDNFIYQATDGKLTTSNITVNITITAPPSPNQAPTAQAATYNANTGIMLSVSPAEGLLKHASDPEGDPLVAVKVSNPIRGNLTLNPDGSFTYIANSSGFDFFSYQVSDGKLLSNVATVSIFVGTLNHPPTAKDDSYSTNEDTTLTVAPSLGLLSNDSDADAGDILTVEPITNPLHGTLVLNKTDGSFTYIPDTNYHGLDSFKYRAKDGKVTSNNEATVTITVNPVNDVPIAGASETYSTNEDVPLTVAAPGLLSNDTDTEGNILSAVVVANPSQGTLVLNADGSFSYTPKANYHGSDSFTYKVGDGQAFSSNVTVNLTVNAVNDAPTAGIDLYSTSQGTPLVVAMPGVLKNDSDLDGDPLTAILVSSTSNGTLEFNEVDGSFSYDPNNDFTGSDSFSYQASDGSLLSDMITVKITVSEVNTINHAPVAEEDGYILDQDTALVVPAEEGVLANDSDTEGNSLTAVLVSPPSHGILDLHSDGSFTYTPNTGHTGPDSFSYQASDGTDQSEVTSVSVFTGVVNANNTAPVGADDSYSILHDTPLTAFAPGLLGNDIDAEGDSMIVLLGNGPSHGILDLQSDGSFTYTPNAGYIGTDSFTYQAQDNRDAFSNPTTVTISILPSELQITTGGNASIEQGNTFVSSGTITDLGAGISSATVDYGDGSGVQPLALSGTSFTLSHRYDRPGDYTVQIAAQDSFGRIGNSSLSVTVQAVADDVAYVRRLYADLLHRDAEEYGLGYWVALLQSGISRAQIAQGVWESQEHRGIQVDSYYSLYLHRPAEAEGRAYWVSVFLAGATETDMQQAFLASSEYQSQHATDADYLTGLYQDVLGRAADAAGMDYWTPILQDPSLASMDARGEAARGFLTSAERYQQLLDRYYADFLHRTPDSMGNEYWLSSLLQGVSSVEAVAIEILASEEYFHRS